MIKSGVAAWLAIAKQIPQNISGTKRHTATFKRLEQNHLEQWDQNFIFGHNHKHHIWRVANKASLMKNTPFLLWNTAVDHWCSGDV